jgi:NADH-quinone oxidoreductase subunit N
MGFLPSVWPEVILGAVACVLFLGGTFKTCRHLWGAVALLGLAGAGLALYLGAERVPTVEARRAEVAALKEAARGDQSKAEELEGKQNDLQALLYSAPVLPTRLALLFKVLALAGGAALVLFSWDEMPPEHAGDYHGCLLLLIAGACLVGAANDLITLFLALELISIPTYVLLYLPRADAAAQEAAMKYFLLSVFSSALLLFGFSYLYGVAGTTSLTGLTDALAAGQADLAGLPAEGKRLGGAWQGVTLVALVMVVAALGFRITAVPFHFYAPDVYQGTTTGMAALLSYVPKLAGFAALVRILGLAPAALPDGVGGAVLGDKALYLLWIMAAVTMSLGNLLALLQDNVKRILAYSSVAHAGYMLIGLAVAPRVSGGAVSGVDSVIFYLVAYGAMTVGAFAVLHYLSSPDRPVETVDDLAGAGRSHPVSALLLALFLFSLIGIPLTAGFAGKALLFFDALGLPRAVIPEGASAEDLARLKQAADERRLFMVLAVIGVLNAAIGAWYYLRMAGVMYLREGLRPLEKGRLRPVLATVWACAALTLFFGVYPSPLLKVVREAVGRPAPAPAATAAVAEGPR